MAKSILKKNKVPPRKFVSPSVATDHDEGAATETAGFSMSQVIALASMVLTLRKKMPRTFLLGAIGFGAYIGYQLWMGKKNPISAMREELH